VYLLNSANPKPWFVLLLLYILYQNLELGIILSKFLLQYFYFATVHSLKFPITKQTKKEGKENEGQLKNVGNYYQ